jgi:hypothetical protein
VSKGQESEFWQSEDMFAEYPSDSHVGVGVQSDAPAGTLVMQTLVMSAENKHFLSIIIFSLCYIILYIYVRFCRGVFREVMKKRIYGAIV